MMPSCYHIDPSSPTDTPQKNGFLREKTTNGKCQIMESLPSKERSEHDHNRFLREGEELVKILETDPKNLDAVSHFVQKYKNTVKPLKNSHYYLRLCDLNGTDYMGQDFMQEAWEEIYPPKETKMQVLGTLEYTRDILPSVPQVILVGEDGCIYAYGNEVLELIAKSLKEFVENGKRFPPYETYDYPESSDEEDHSQQQDQEILQIRQRGKDFVNKSAEKFDSFLSFVSS
ncbi:uncharacterized protein [Dendropsophus ebraccatus]|uniref:uncharacterized protein n=1 Tax=Dendropsophus ebraccatus TaxID=150705 RepID=UPI0038322A89